MLSRTEIDWTRITFCVSIYRSAGRWGRPLAAMGNGGIVRRQVVLGLLLSPSEVLVLMIITAVVVFLASRKGRAK